MDKGEKHKRPSIQDVEREDLEWLAESFDIAETKEDGIWCWVVVRSGVGTIIRRSGLTHGTVDLEGVPDCTLCAELLIWSPRSKASVDYGNYRVFDCLEVSGRETSCAPLSERRALAESIVATMPEGWRMVRQWTDLAEALQYSIDHDLEGIVIKRSVAPHGEPWARVVL